MTAVMDTITATTFRCTSLRKRLYFFVIQPFSKRGAAGLILCSNRLHEIALSRPNYLPRLCAVRAESLGSLQALPVFANSDFNYLHSSPTLGANIATVRKPE